MFSLKGTGFFGSVACSINFNFTADIRHTFDDDDLNINSIVTIKHPLDALSELLTKDESFDLVVTNVNKPSIYGFGFRQQITQTYRLPVLLMSRAKIIWTESLHYKFLTAIRDIGFEEAKPAKILEHMKVPGLTRRNVSSHLQKYRNYLRQVIDRSRGIQAPNANQLTIASGTLDRYSQFHQENFQLQSSVPSSLIHTSTGYLNFMNQGTVQPHQEYRNYLRQVTDTSCGIQAPDVNFASSQFHRDNFQVQSSIPRSSIHTSTGYLTDNFMNQGTVQPHQKYRYYLRQITDTSRGIPPGVNFAGSGNQLSIASGTLGRFSQSHQENFQVQSSIPRSSIHTSTGYLTGNFMNQATVQPHQQNNEGLSVNFHGGFNSDMEQQDYQKFVVAFSKKHKGDSSCNK